MSTYVLRLCAFLLTVFAFGPVVHAQQVWPNLPANSQILLDHNFSAALGPRMTNVYNSGRLTQLNEPGMVSPTGTFESWMCALCATGGSELHWTADAPLREIYMGMMWRTNPEFQGRPNSNKLFFLRGPQANGVWIFGNSALVNGSAPWIFGHNTGGGLLDNSHACALDLGLACYPNTGADGSLHVGTWTKLEAYVKASTTNTSRDGIVKWWKNGVLVGNYTNLNYGGVAGLTEWVWSETWDGCGTNGAPPCFLGPTGGNTLPWSHFLDHLILATCNGCATGGGGGGGTSPPPPPPLPPNKPTNLRVQ